MCSRTGGTAGEEGRGEEREEERGKLNWILAIFMVARVEYNGIIILIMQQYKYSSETQCTCIYGCGLGCGL